MKISTYTLEYDIWMTIRIDIEIGMECSAGQSINKAVGSKE
jgi:hypothetical protein